MTSSATVRSKPKRQHLPRSWTFRGRQLLPGPLPGFASPGLIREHGGRARKPRARMQINGNRLCRSWAKFSDRNGQTYFCVCITRICVFSAFFATANSAFWRAQVCPINYRSRLASRNWDFRFFFVKRRLFSWKIVNKRLKSSRVLGMKKEDAGRFLGYVWTDGKCKVDLQIEPLTVSINTHNRWWHLLSSVNIGTIVWSEVPLFSCLL